MRKQILSERYCLYFMFVAGGSVYAIVVDPARDRLYVGGGKGFEVFNVDGSNTIKMLEGSTFSLAVDLKAG